MKKLLVIRTYLKLSICSIAMCASEILLANAQNSAPQGSPGFGPLIPLILIFGVFYFLVIRPQQKKQKQHEQFLRDLKRGDMVVTQSGIVGTIKNLSDRFVILEVDEGVSLKILRSAIAENASNLKQQEVTSSKSIPQTT